MNPVWFSTVALVRFLLGRVSDECMNLHGDELDGLVVAFPNASPLVSFEIIFNPL